MMERVLCNLQWDIVLLYLDDIIVFSTNIVQQFERLELVFQRLRAANLKLKPKKCFLFKKEVKFLGHVVSQQGVATDPEKIQAVVEWPTPHSVKAVRAFLGLTGYYRKFIREYASIAVPLTDLTKKGVKFAWNGDAQGAFEYLQQQLVSAPILGYPNKEGGFILDTDASGCSIGCVLSQLQEGVERVIAYGSKKLSKSERNYCVTRRELLSIVWFMEHFKHYLIGRPFLVRTDHNSLRWLFSFKEPEGQVARWLERLSAFNFKIEHRPGIRHGNSDALSRIPCQTPCRYCHKGHDREEEVPTKPPQVRRVCQKTQQTPQGRTARKRLKKVSPTSITNEWRETIRKWQQEDPSYQILHSWKEKPAWQEISHLGEEVKYHWARWKQLKEETGVAVL